MKSGLVIGYIFFPLSMIPGRRNVRDTYHEEWNKMMIICDETII